MEFFDHTIHLIHVHRDETHAINEWDDSIPIKLVVCATVTNQIALQMSTRNVRLAQVNRLNQSKVRLKKGPTQH
jgi:hypothetical protein